MQVITPSQAQEILSEKDAILIDVREVEEFQDAHIDGAVNIPLSTFEQSFQDFQCAPDQDLIFMCLKGMRSQRACEFVQAHNMCDNEIYTMQGGIDAWANSGLPVTR